MKDYVQYYIIPTVNYSGNIIYILSVLRKYKIFDSNDSNLNINDYDKL